MELYVIHDCTHVSAIRMDVTIPWDFTFMVILLYRMVVSIPWILDLQMILLIWMVVPMLWILSYSPYYLDGCAHDVDSCLALRYVYVYAPLICRSPDSVCHHPCKIS